MVSADHNICGFLFVPLSDRAVRETGVRKSGSCPEKVVDQTWFDLAP
jgi:hypothetical protein